MNRFRGFSLVELMVSITIGLILLAAISQVFIASRSTYTLEEGMARSQESGRFAIDFITRELRMAGHAGCSGHLRLGTIASGQCNANTVCNLAKTPTMTNTFSPAGIVAYKYTGNGTSTNLTDWTPNLPAAYFSNGQVRAGTDVMIVQYGDLPAAQLVGITGPTNTNLKILESSPLANLLTGNGDVLIVSDCRGADTFLSTAKTTASGEVTIGHDGTLNSQTSMTHLYDNRAELMGLVNRAYFIASGASGEPSLFRSNGNGTPAVELVEGVEDMRLSFGEDTDANAVANLYRTANQVVTWENVVSVRVGLLVRTTNNVEQVNDTKTYDLTGITVGPFNDKRRRQAYNTTVQLRNPLRN